MSISATTWDLIDQRKKVKLQGDPAKTLTTACTLDKNYRATNRAVKRTCKSDKKNWLESKCQEVEQAASRYRLGTDTSKSMPIRY